MPWQVESDVAHGRGFADTDATGFLAKLAAWVVKAPAAGGPGWTLHDDLTACVAKTFETSDVSTGDETITISGGHGLSHMKGIVFTSTNTVPGGLTSGTQYYAIIVSDTVFKVASSTVNAVKGIAINITSAGSGTHTVTPNNPFIVVTDVASPNWNDVNTGLSGLPPKYLIFTKQDNQAGYIQVQACLWWDKTTHKGYGYYGGSVVVTLDDSDFNYYFRGGTEGIIISSRIGSSWSHAGVLDFEGDANLVEGITSVGTLDGAATAGSSVVLQLHSGEAANFTQNNYYFIMDFNGVEVCNYVFCTSVDTDNDRVTIQTLTDNMGNGAIISAYAHRFVFLGTDRYPGAIQLNFSGYGSSGSVEINQAIPYCSGAVGYAMHYQIVAPVYITSATKFDVLVNTLQQMNPDDLSRRAAMRPLVGEWLRPNDAASFPSTGMNRSYGQIKNIYAAYSASRVKGSDGLTIGAKDYVFLATMDELSANGSVSVDLLFLDTEST
jgi:hypothetical protein